MCLQAVLNQNVVGETAALEAKVLSLLEEVRSYSRRFPVALKH